MKRFLFLFLSLCLILTGCTAPVLTIELKDTPPPSPSASPLLAAPTGAPVESPSIPDPVFSEETASPSVSPTPASTPDQPPLLSRLLEQQNLTFDDLSFDQLVLVAADGTSCALYAYDRGADGAWVKAFSANGHVGRKGVSANKREGDECTPAGLYALGFAFGHDENPNSDYPFRAIRSDSYWVDDPDSRFYNQWVDGTQDKDWTSAEALGRIRTDYALAVAVEYNYGSSAVPGRGSAIFLHVGSKPTSGCISMPKSDLTALIRWLNADADPHILIASK